MGEYEMKCAEQGLLRQVVLKSYHLTTRDLHMHFIKTCSKLGALRGVTNVVVPVVGVFNEDKWSHVLMHYYENGDLATWITNHPQRDPQLCLRMAHQIVCAVEGLHEQDIVHCDLKPENIFLTPTLKVILGDFDNVRDANSTMTSSVGLTRKYEAPEIRMGTVDKYDKSADVYSLGLVLQDIFEGLDMSGHAADASEMNISALIDRMTASDHTYRPLLREVMQSTIFKNVQASRQCAICYEAFIAAESLTCRKGHVVCDCCVDDWLKYDMTDTSHITRTNGWLPCPMQAHGCEKIWEPKVYAPHVTEKTFGEAMCLINKPKVRKELLLEQQRETAENRISNYIADEILTMKCPEMGHVLNESFDACFALTCASCPKGRNHFCTFFWNPTRTGIHAHVEMCEQNPVPGELFHSAAVFYEIRRRENQRKL